MMKIADRWGPLLYAGLHSPQMLWELALTPLECWTAVQAARRLERGFPFMRSYEACAARLGPMLRPAYDAYTSSVSPSSITVSFPLAVFLAVLCEQRQPDRVLDLGSGFSSYVFRWGATPERRVCSVDVSSTWLERTARFLEGFPVERKELVDLQSLSTAGRREQFDLVFHDIAELSDRLDMLELVMKSCRPGGLLVLDDMHVPRYRAAVVEALRAANFELYSLRPRTRQSWRLRYAYLAVRP